MPAAQDKRTPLRSRRRMAINHRLVENFLIPRLDSGCYGSLLCWTDKERGVFRIAFHHKSNQMWTVESSKVFEDWSRLKRRWDPVDPKRYVRAKQRFRAALQKNGQTLEYLEQESNEGRYRVYKICNIHEIRRTQLENTSPETISYKQEESFLSLEEEDWMELQMKLDNDDFVTDIVNSLTSSLFRVPN